MRLCVEECETKKALIFTLTANAIPLFLSPAVIIARHSPPPSYLSTFTISSYAFFTSSLSLIFVLFVFTLCFLIMYLIPRLTFQNIKRKYIFGSRSFISSDTSKQCQIPTRSTFVNKRVIRIVRKRTGTDYFYKVFLVREFILSYTDFRLRLKSKNGKK